MEALETSCQVPRVVSERILSGKNRVQKLIAQDDNNAACTNGVPSDKQKNMRMFLPAKGANAAWYGGEFSDEKIM